MAKFHAPVIQDNPSGWGPCAVPEKFKDMPYQPFSKGDRLGKVCVVFFKIVSGECFGGLLSVRLFGFRIFVWQWMCCAYRSLTGPGPRIKIKDTPVSKTNLCFVQFNEYSVGVQWMIMMLWFPPPPHLSLDKYSSQFGGGSHYAYFHEEDETSFQLVDTAKTQKTAYQRNRMRFAQVM